MPHPFDPNAPFALALDRGMPLAALPWTLPAGFTGTLPGGTFRGSLSADRGGRSTLSPGPSRSQRMGARAAPPPNLHPGALRGRLPRAFLISFREAQAGRCSGRNRRSVSRCSGRRRHIAGRCSGRNRSGPPASLLGCDDTARNVSDDRRLVAFRLEYAPMKKLRLAFLDRHPLSLSSIHETERNQNNGLDASPRGTPARG